jgi:cytochrome c-type biogenesis protein CcmE
MRPKTIVGIVLMVAFTSMLMISFGNQVGGYMDFVQAAEAGSRAHVVGNWVREQQFQYDRDRNIFSFHMTDEKGQTMQVRYNNPKPANFEDADQLVVEGYMRGDYFLAQHILVKCPSKYNDVRDLEVTPASTY